MTNFNDPDERDAELRDNPTNRWGEPLDVDDTLDTCTCDDGDPDDGFNPTCPVHSDGTEVVDDGAGTTCPHCDDAAVVNENGECVHCGTPRPVNNNDDDIWSSLETSRGAQRPMMS